MKMHCDRLHSTFGWRGFWLLAAILMGSAALVSARPAVSARGGNIYIVNDAGVEKQLTSSGHDSNPVLDPAGQWIVFVRETSKKAVASGAGEHPATELWQVRADGKEPLMLLAARESDKMESLVATFDEVQFSSDGRLVYFVTAAWATSGAVHVVDTTNRKERFVIAGNGLQTIPSGEYRDHLLVSQHRYFLGGGSYDWYYLFTAAGKEVGVVGESTENFIDLYVKSPGFPAPSKSRPVSGKAR
jgi:hypothetical protein